MKVPRRSSEDNQIAARSAGQLESRPDRTRAAVPLSASAEGIASSQPAGHRPLIVGIGVSGRGSAALCKLIEALPASPGMTLVIVPQGGTGKQVLSEAVRRAASMRVAPVRSGARPAVDSIYVASPGVAVAIDAQGLLRTTRIGKGPAALLDPFFISLAESHKDAAVGILLSGSGGDGAAGLQAIRDHGGMTMIGRADDDDAASGMAAEAAGPVDHVLAPEEMAAELAAYATFLRQSPGSQARATQRRSLVEHVRPICEMLERQTGHDFKHYKTSTLARRIQRRMHVTRCRTADAYVLLLERSREEAEALFKDLLIGVTAFFRDKEAFERLAGGVIPKLFENRRADETVRVWVPGCSTGEEAYSLAMLLREQADRAKDPPRVQVFATDIDARALRVARRGRYPLGIAQQVSEERLRRFFTQTGRRYEVSAALREMCLFSPHNLIADPPFSRLDLISCRNVLIYMGPPLQKKLVAVFHYALRPNGYLFLGPSESIESHAELFRTVDARQRISQRRPAAIRQEGLTVKPHREREPLPLAPAEAEAGDVGRIAQRMVLDEFAPCYAVVNDEFRTIFLSPEVGKYLQPSGGTFDGNIVKMARSGLRAGLRSALTKAHKTRRRVVHNKINVRCDGGPQRLELTVQPMPALGQDAGLFLVVFKELPPMARRENGDGLPSDEAEAVIAQLESELAGTREDLESAVQELEAANEELKSSNEELLSMNEELQSANEELETSKEEVQSGLDALARANTDLENLLSSSQIATIFLNDDHVIQRFTPAARRVYHLIESDVGRPLSHITHRAGDMPPLPSARAVGSAKEVLESEIRVNGQWYTRRVLPYLTRDGRREGLVVTFHDVTAQKQSQERLAESQERLQAAIDAGGVGTWRVDLARGRQTRDAPLNRILGLAGRETTQELADFHGRVHHDDRREVERAWKRALRRRGDYQVEHRIIRPDGGVRWIRNHGRVLSGADGKPACATGAVADITERKAAEAALETRERQQAAVARLGRDALVERDLQAILDAAARTVAQTLDVELCKLLELAPGGEHLVLRAGLGWRRGVVGKATEPTGEGSQAGYALASSEPVVTEDLSAETRFEAPALLAEHGAVSGMTCIIWKADGRPYGVMGAHTKSRRAFSRDDVNFLQAIANVVGAAIQRNEIEAALSESEATLRSYYHATPAYMGVVELLKDDILHLYDNDAAARFFGQRPGRTAGKRATEMGVGSAALREWRRRLRQAQRSGKPVRFEHLHQEEPVARWLSATVSCIGPSASGRMRFCYVAEDVTDRKLAEQRQAAEHAVSRVLAESSTLEQAAPALLASICETLGADFAELFVPTAEASRIVCLAAHAARRSQGLAQFARVTREISFTRGKGLPGRTWKRLEPTWIQNVQSDRNFPRNDAATAAGLRTGFGFPVMAGDDFAAAISFYTPLSLSPTPALVETMASIGRSIGQFLQRCRAEEEVRRSEQELADFVENATVGLHWVGPDGVIKWANKAELAMLGYERDEYVGRSITEFHADQQVIDDILERLREGQSLCNYEARLRCKDGSIRHVVIDSNVLFEQGRFVHTRCFTRDVTAERRARQALIESEQRFRRLANSAPVLIWMSGTEKQGTWFNKPWLDFTGRTMEQELGDGWLQGVHPEDFDRCVGTCLQAFESRVPFRVEFRLRRNDGEYRWVLDEGVPLSGADGEFLGYIGGCVDITERKRAEDVSRFIAQAGEILSSSLEYQTTLNAVANLVVPRIADWCAVDLLRGDRVELAAVAHSDPEKVEFVHHLRRNYPTPLDSPTGVANVLRTGASELYAEVADDLLKAAAQDEAHLVILRELNLRSALLAPLKVRGRTIGVLTLVQAESGRRFTEDDVPLVEELARRCAASVENARLYREVQEALESHRRVEDRLSLLIQASHDLLGALDVEHAQDSIRRVARRLIPADAYAIWRRDAGSGQWRITSSDGLSQAFVGGSVMDAGAADKLPEAPVTVTAETIDGESDEMLVERYALYRREGIRSLMIVPVRVRGRPAQTIVCYHRRPHAFSEEERRVAAALGNMAGAALTASELYLESQREVQQRREAEEALRESRERLRFTIESAQVGTWFWDIANNDVHWSDNLPEIHGRERGSFSGSFQAVLEDIHPDDRLRFQETVQRTVESGDDYHIEYRIVRPDGGVRWLEGIGRVTRDGSGRPVSMSGICRDVTGRKEAEQGLLRSERIYRGIGESINYGIWICDETGRNIYASESFLNLVGLTQEQCSEFGWGDVLHPDDAAETIDSWKRCATSGDFWEREHRFRGVDGQWHYILARGAPIRDEDGRLLCWAGINLDIGNLKRAEAAARESEQRVRHLLQAGRDAILVYPVDERGMPGTFVEANQAACDRLGWSREELLGMSLRDITPRDDEHLRTLFRELLAQGEAITEMTHVTRSGQAIPVEVSARVAVLGGQRHVISIGRDITDRKRAEERVRAEATLRRTIENAVPDGIAAVDDEGRQIYVNRAFCRMVGWSEEELLDTSPPYPYWPREEMEPIQRAFEATLRGEAPEEGFELRFQRRNGERFDVLLRIDRVESPGLITGWLAAVTDITERRRAEQALRQSELRKGAILESAIDCLITMDHEGCIVDFNPAAERTFGYRREEVLGKTVAETLIPERYRKAHWEGLEHFQQTGEGALLDQRIEVTALRSDGTEIPVELAIAAVTMKGKPPFFTAYLRDISQRKAAERALRDSEERLRAVIDTAVDGIITIDERGVVESLNPAAVRLFGYEPAEVIGRNVSMLMPQPYRDEHDTYISNYLTTGIPRIIGIGREVVGRRKDGTMFPMELAVSETRLEGRRLFTGLVRDISERKQAEEALRESEEQFRRAIEEAPVPIIMQAEDGEVLQISRSWTELTGYALEDVADYETWSAAAYGEGGEAVREGVQELFRGRGGMLDAEFELRTRDGKTRFWRFSASSPGRMRDGRRFVVGMAVDITERRRAENALQDAYNQRRLALEAGEIGTWDWNVEKDTVYWDYRCRSVFGIDDRAIMGAATTRRLVHREDRRRVAAAVREALDPRTPGDLDIEYRLNRDDGERWVAVRGEALFEGEGDDRRAVRVVGTVIDITDRKQAEASIHEHARTLETLNRVNASLAGELELERVVQAVTDAGTELTGAQFGAFFYNVEDAAGERYTLYTLSGAPREAFEKFPMPRNTDLFGPTFRGDGVVRIDDVLQDPRYGTNAPYHGMPEGHLPVRSYLAVPVMSRGGQVLGGLFFGHARPGVFTEQAERLMTGIAAQASIAIDNARLFGERTRLAAIVESSQDAIIGMNLDARIVTWNRGAERTFGYSQAEMLGKSIRTLVPDDRQQEVERIWNSIRTGEFIEPLETERLTRDGRVIPVLLTVSPVHDRSGNLVGASSIARDITERRRAEEHQRLLLAELSHRVKNTLATVQSVAMQTTRHSRSLDEFNISFERRLHALAQAHALLTQSNWDGAALADIIGKELEPHNQPGRHNVMIEGPPVTLRPKPALALHLVVHELATNAAKYGALSREGGRVEVRWSMGRGEEGRELAIDWSESNGPPVSPPTKRGFGSEMIASTIEYELDGRTMVHYRPQGLHCELRIPWSDEVGYEVGQPVR